jgi:hypothetical protein
MRKVHLRIIMILCIAGLLLVILPVTAIKTADQSLSGSLTRGSRFTVTIAGLPNSGYYIWLPGTSSMTGEPGDQPPVIADNQADVDQDPPGGPYTIGSYQYSNGGGQTIRDDVAPSSADISDTSYYAIATTDSAGVATVEFQTSLNTGLRRYSVHVENPRSVESDNLGLSITLFRRTAPITVSVATPREPVTSVPEPTVTLTPTPTLAPIPLTTSITSQPATLANQIPVPSPTSNKASFESSLCIVAFGAILLAGRRQ